MNHDTVRFVVPGPPVGKGRPRFARRGAFVRAYTDAKTASYENLVKLAAAQAMDGQPPLAGAVAVELYLFLTPPASWSQKKQRAAIAGEIMPTSKPDADNCFKAVSDACNDVVWVDDKQIVEAVIRKAYAVRAETLVVVRAA